MIPACGQSDVSLPNGDQNSIYSTEQLPLQSQTVQQWTITKEQVSAINRQIEFMPGELIPVLLDGTVKGYLDINWVQRLGIWDFNNISAVVSGVKTSYTINVNVDFSESIGAGDSRIITIKPYLIDTTDTVIGNPCNVGWSGFGQIAQLYDKDKDINIEFGLQPETLDETDARIKLVITDNLGNQYDDIYLANKYLETASSGPTLVTEGTRTVNTINGGAFAIGVRQAHIESRADNSNNNNDSVRYYDIDYFIQYVNQPTNNREDLLFDSNNGNVLRTKFVMSVLSDVDITKLYTSDESATRQKYSNKTDLYTYVTTEFYDLQEQYEVEYTTNRIVPSSTGNPEYIRVCFEFPEEADARSLYEMRDFNGRFLVIQKQLSNRELEYFDYSMENQE